MSSDSKMDSSACLTISNPRKGFGLSIYFYHFNLFFVVTFLVGLLVDLLLVVGLLAGLLVFSLENSRLSMYEPDIPEFVV